MKKIICLILTTVFMNSVLASEYVTFGEFNNGTNLYSNSYPPGNYEIYGRDVYPDRATIDKTCTTEITCKKYSYHYETTCVKYYPFNDRCLVYSKKKILDGCIKNKTVTTCKRTQIMCVNPNGESTNQLSLSNFKMSFDGITWGNVPYSRDEIPLLINSSVIFKVDIPDICSPTYKINEAINIKSI